MQTRAQALEHHSPAVWCLVAVGLAFTAEVIVFAAWNAWEHREQLVDHVVRLLNH